MGLMAWYPFNGDYKNYGLGDLELTVATTPTFSVGKTGQGLTTGAFSWTATQTASVLNNKELSICFWLYVNAETGSTTKRAMLFGHEGGMSTQYNNRKFSLFQYPCCNDLHWSWQNDDASTVFTNGIVYNAFPSYTWTHVAVTYNNPTGKIYINGELKTTFTGVSNSSTFAHATEVIHNNAYRTVCDFRVYNHALSVREVKQVSQALILHYPMNHSGFGNVNLLTGSNFEICSTASTAASTTGISVQVASEYLPQLIGKKITFSFYYDCVGERANDPNYSYGNRFGMHCTLNYVNTSGTTVTTYPCTSYLVMSGKGRAVQTYAIPSDCASINYFTVAVQPLAKPVATSKEIWWLARPKIEFGTTATAWCPGKNDALYSQLGLDDGIEYDCSGFRRNGTYSSTQPTWTSDSMRYSGSYDFSNGSYIVTPAITTSFFSNSWTIAYWAKNTDISGDMAWGFSDGNRLNVFPSGYGYFCMNTGDSSQNPFKDSSGNNISFYPYQSVWHHYVITGNGVSNILYIDGVQVGTSTTYRSITGSQIYISGWDASTSYKWSGQISDFRLYATALSAEDISDIYKNVGSIDKNGNFYAYEYIEEDLKWI